MTSNTSNNNPLSPRGAMKRLPFVVTNIAQFVALGFLNILTMAASDPGLSAGVVCAVWAANLLFVYSILCTVIKRCRDAGISVWWSVCALIPLACIGIFVYLWIARAKRAPQAAPEGGLFAKERSSVVRSRC